MIARLRARLRTAGDTGISLVELLVAMVVLGIVATLVTQLSVQIGVITSDASRSRSAVGTASTAMNAMTKVLRVAGPVPTSLSATLPAVTAASATSVTVSSWVDTSATVPLPTAVTYATTGGRLVETRAAGTRSGAYYSISSTTATRTLAQPVTVTFAYQDAGGSAVTTFTPTTLPTIRSIVVTVSVAGASQRGAAPFVLTNTVVLQNAALQDRSAS